MLELIGTLTGIFTSIIALVVSVVVFRAEKKLNMNSVRPYLKAYCGSHKDKTYVRIANYGMGPAILETVLWYTEGQVELDAESLAHYVWNKANDEHFEIGAFHDFVPEIALKERAIEPGGELFLIDYRSADPSKCDFTKRALSDIHLEITYRDIFGNLQDNTCTLDCGWLGCHTCEDGGPLLARDI